MLKYYFIAAEFRAFLSDRQFPDSQDWLHFAIRTAAQSRTTKTQLLKLPEALPKCYAKTYCYPRWRDRLRICWRGGLLGRSRAQVEFENLARLQKKNLAPRVVIFAQKRRFGFLTESLLLVEEVPNAVPFDAFVAGQLRQLSPKRRHQLIDSLALFTQKMNADGFLNTEFHWRNLLIEANEKNFVLQVIDPSAHRRRYQWLYPFFDLATMDIAAPFFFSRSERLRFYKCYHNTLKQKLNQKQKKEIKQIQRL